MNTAPPQEDPQFLSCDNGRTIAYHTTAGQTPGVLFLGGFLSDMTGTKALALETFCHQTGRAFTRFDYSGHGDSSGEFVNGTIGSWRDDALAILDTVTSGKQILVGSSMGAWIMLLVALQRKEQITAMIGIAPAPDLTQDLIWEEMSQEQRATLKEKGRVEIPNDYDERPYPITTNLIEEGRQHLLLKSPIDLECPVRLIHGMADKDVPPETSIKLAAALKSDNVTITYIKDGDHRLSDMSALTKIFMALAEIANVDSELSDSEPS